MCVFKPGGDSARGKHSHFIIFTLCFFVLFTKRRKKSGLNILVLLGRREKGQDNATVFGLKGIRINKDGAIEEGGRSR